MKQSGNNVLRNYINKIILYYLSIKEKLKDDDFFKNISDTIDLMIPFIYNADEALLDMVFILWTKLASLDSSDKSEEILQEIAKRDRTDKYSIYNIIYKEDFVNIHNIDDFNDKMIHILNTFKSIYILHKEYIDKEYIDGDGVDFHEKDNNMGFILSLSFVFESLIVVNPKKILVFLEFLKEANLFFKTDLVDVSVIENNLKNKEKFDNIVNDIYLNTNNVIS